jgi:FSR family fosmidomycin resistance protein-like MFS transporter
MTATAAEDAKPEERRAFAIAAGAHALHDGYTDMLYLMLPIWQAQFALGYAAVGLLKGVFSAVMAGFQIPAGALSERLGAGAVLAAGTALAGFGYCVAGLSAGFVMLISALVIAGLGATTQHPIASALVARAYAGPRSLKALGGYNFAGDVGKIIFPATAALLIAVMPWRSALMILGAVGLAAAVAIFVGTPRFRDERGPPKDTKERSEISTGPKPHFFPLLLSIGVIDSATRSGFLTFLPFLLATKGATVPAIGIALTLVFAGGAAGKLVCAFIGARIGVIATVWLTEALTIVTILVLLPLPLDAAYFLLPMIGVALNGTSSVLYGSVPDVVAPERRTRAFGIFYTGTIGTSATAPAIFGFVGDALGIPTTLAIVAMLVVLTLPLALFLRPAFSR